MSLEEGAALMSLGRNNFREVAKDARAVYKIKRRVLINMEKITSSWKLSWMMKSKGGRDHGKNFIRM